ncbi:hypothetical protein V5799_011523 [Amblyomma americanum]|uniref:Uncharacterized protein n=1 Tax=Amblyomma americanum TaxID=6943 RepID=A0AAQ4EGZ1_AMBAM
MAGRIKSYLGVTAPFFLAPLLFFDNLRLARSTAAKDRASPTPSPEEPSLPGPGFPWALVRMDDVVRQMVNALRSACMESPQLRLLRARRRSQAPELTDTQTPANSGMLHATTTTATSRTTPYELSRVQTSPLAGSSVSRRVPRSMPGVFRDQGSLARPLFGVSVPRAPAVGAGISRCALRVTRDSLVKEPLRTSPKSSLGNATPLTSRSRESIGETNGGSCSPSAHPSLWSPGGLCTPPNSAIPRTPAQTSTMSSK